MPLPAHGFGLSYIQAQQEAPGWTTTKFRGPVKAVEACTFLNRPAWRVTATLLRSEDGQTDMDIPIYVSQDKLPPAFSPTRGTDLTGILWLKGSARSAS